MATLIEGAKLIAFYNGGFCQYLTSIGFKTESGVQRLESLNEGLVGFTSGTGMCTIELGFLIPSSGPEHTYQEDCANEVAVSLQIGTGDKSYAAIGKIESCDFSQSTNGAVEGTLTWTGPKKPIE